MKNERDYWVVQQGIPDDDTSMGTFAVVVILTNITIISTDEMNVWKLPSLSDFENLLQGIGC
jgi:hypothetical protein